MRAPVAALLSLALFLGAASSQAFETEALHHTGDSANRLDIVILGDGYRAQDQEKMTEDALKVIDAFWGMEFFSRYRNFINVKLIHVISNEAGADNSPTQGDQRDTALNARFWCSGIERLLCVDTSTVQDIAFEYASEYDELLVIVNDQKYGGSGGTVSVMSMGSGALDIGVHEIGHSLFGLADEYFDDENIGAPCDPVSDCSEPNATVFTQFDQIKWNHWLESSTPLPTPEHSDYDNVVGLFEGVRYHAYGQYRPWRDCNMKSLGKQYCPVCTEQAIRRIYEFAHLEDTSLPEEETVTMTTAESVRFAIQGPRPTPNTVTATWYKDGVALPEYTADDEQISGASLGVGTFELRLDLRDDTTMVRLDPDELLLASRTWTVTVEQAPDVGSGGSGGGTGGQGDTGGTTSGGSENVLDEHPPVTRDDDGCSCRAAGRSPASAPAGLLLLAGGLLFFHRRRRSTSLS